MNTPYSVVDMLVRREVLIDENDHSAAAVLSASILKLVMFRAGVSTAIAEHYAFILEEIHAGHELSGSIAYHDRNARDGLVGMINTHLALYGYE